MKGSFYLATFGLWAGLAGLLPIAAFGQAYTVTGKVTDASTGEAVPFANVYIKKTTIGTVTDFEGRYKLPLDNLPDSLYASSVGFRPRAKHVKPGEKTQTINFQIQPKDVLLQEVVITPGENPAWPILRKVIAAKDKNDKRALDAMEYESYNRVEIDVDNLSEDFKKRKLVKKIKAVMDSIQRVQGEDGKPIIPIFMSETVTVVYKRSSPDKTKEKIIKSKVSGIGIQPTSILNQMLGSSFQEYNFYRNWLNIFNKYFVSPIADGWKFYYDYDLKDSMMVGNDYCYKINFYPKRPQDLAFQGTIWITKEHWALKQIDCKTGDKANINFIDKVKIQQELTRLPEGSWVPSKNRVLVDISQPTKNTAGMLAKFYTSNRNFLINQPKPVEFFDMAVEKAENVNTYDEAYWAKVRHDSLTVTEKNIFRMIDTVKKLPVVRSYVEVANIAVNGHKKLGPVDIGPYIYLYANNSVEGNRFRVGFRTNSEFSRKFTYKGYIAYGTRDGRFKYESNAEYLFSRRHWTVLGTRIREDLELLALFDNSIAANNLFNAFARFGNLRNSRPFYLKQGQTYFSSEVLKGITLGGSIETSQYKFNTGQFDFQYFPQSEGTVKDTISDFKTAELNGEIRIALDETYLENQNSRISLGAFKWPIFTLRYTKGFSGFAKGEFDYHRYQFIVQQWLNLGYLGKARYTIDAGYIPNTLPYPLLRPHLGNQTPFFNASSFNQMRFFEFVSDHWVQFGYQHFFEGFLVNSVPKVRNWNLRLLATSNVLFGGMSRQNYELAKDYAHLDKDGNPTQPFHILDRNKPYVEVGYGVENIFRLVRVDFVHRLTYLNLPNAKPFGVKVSVQFKI